ncbi:MAG: DUF2505 domain-containing protein [Myxococcota bacterium]|nr:DUF2505 domain-containing protein [Myxococcota bacterium]MDW8361408.1 DUF2505 family protein [Myxococcales bacterium]
MASAFTARHVLETDEETYWSRVFFDPEYNRRLYLEGLSFASFEWLSYEQLPGGDRTRRMRMVPSDVPAIVRRVAGDAISYVEEGRWDARTRRWTFAIVPNRLAERVRICGTLWVEPCGPRRIERICENEVEVRVLGVGGAIENYLVRTSRDSFEKAAAFTNRFLAERGL